MIEMTSQRIGDCSRPKRKMLMIRSGRPMSTRTIGAATSRAKTVMASASRVTGRRITGSRRIRFSLIRASASKMGVFGCTVITGAVIWSRTSIGGPSSRSQSEHREPLAGVLSDAHRISASGGGSRGSGTAGGRRFPKHRRGRLSYPALHRFSPFVGTYDPLTSRRSLSGSSSGFRGIQLTAFDPATVPSDLRPLYLNA